MQKQTNNQAKKQAKKQKQASKAATQAKKPAAPSKPAKLSAPKEMTDALKRKVSALHGKGWSNKAIGRELGIGDKRVAKVLRELAPATTTAPAAKVAPKSAPAKPADPKKQNASKPNAKPSVSGHDESRVVFGSNAKHDVNVLISVTVPNSSCKFVLDVAEQAARRVADDIVDIVVEAMEKSAKCR